MAQLEQSQEGGGQSSISILRVGSSEAQGELAHFFFCIENLGHVRRAFGRQVAAEVRASLGSVLAKLIRKDGVVHEAGEGADSALIWGEAAFGPRPDLDCPRFLEIVCQQVSLVPVSTSVGPIHIWVSGSWAFVPEGLRDNVRVAAHMHDFRGEQASNGASWSAQFRTDMALVGQGLAAIAATEAMGDGRGGQGHEFQLAWQPVRSTSNPSAVLYYESLLHVVADNGSDGSATPMVLAFERLGYARYLDQHIVGRVIDELLSSNHAVLGVNISAQSAKWDSGWSELMDRLISCPGAASRLVVEITETAPITDIGEAVRFASRLRSLGCQIAIDDFGVGHTSIRELFALSPNIVKIDKLFLRRAATSSAGAEALMHIAGLARSFGTIVVIEGVETALEVEISSGAGIEWQQGYYLGRPCTVRPWLLGNVPAPSRASELCDGMPLVHPQPTFAGQARGAAA
ncbi:EAL domain-containing protein (putative c-di-GMP-specific phosphodiesterase class I) [Sphingobium sp. B1D7B]|uniref:EAL domain-containing protein n=1 Tax=Sphingobium sp. B1D7B TaxID=2940578 RepID=UPI00222424B2|nr:EAL domain-containing protein [Sphingobium sp. B1D7B]MCW2406951.1 EAL domain-containing protein (putative c-di-GMP-specific phosphodiesterase class I) [Sphingobium sp. B1D7B]